MKKLGFAVFSVILIGALLSCATNASRHTQESIEAFDHGVEHLNRGENDRAIVEFTAALAIAPNCAFTLHNRGMAYARRGDLDRAIADFTSSLRIRPNSADTLHLRGVAYVGRGDLDRAIADFSAALRIDPNNTYALQGLAIAEAMRAAAPAQVAQAETGVQAIPAVAGNPAYFSGTGNRGTRIAVLVPDAVGLPAEQDYLPTLVQGVLVGDLSRFSAMTVLDRQSLESVLHETESGIYQSPEDFGRLGQIVNVDYVLTGNITRTGTGHALQIQVVGTRGGNIGVTRASSSTNPTLAEMDDFTGIRRASLELLTQMGVNLTPRGRQQLAGTEIRQSINAQVALAQGITAYRQGLEVEAMSRFIQSAAYNPDLAETESRFTTLNASMMRVEAGTGAMHEIAMRRQWMDRLQETETFFAATTQRQPYFIVYEPRLREGAINHHNETMELSFWMTLVPDQVWVNSVNQVVANVARGLRATGRAGDWGLDWPANHVSFTSPFTNRTSTIAVVAELVNDQGVSIGRQTVNIPAGYDIHSRVSRAIVARQWEGDVVFPAVDINLITNRVSIRVSSIDGLSAEDAARQRGITVMPNEEFFFATGIRRAPMNTSQFTVQPNGTLTLWSGTGTEVVIPFMVNGVRVTAIGDGVFNNRGLTSVTIPDTVTSIGQDAFRENRLTSITIPGSVTVIGAGAFNGVRQRGTGRGQLRTIGLPDSITSIGDAAFANNELTSVTIPDSITSIGNNAFSNNRLTSVTIGSNVTSIGSGAFQTNQLTRVTIPDSVRTIGGNAFAGSGQNNQVTSITIGADIMNLPNNAFMGNFGNFYTQNGRRAGTYTATFDTVGRRVVMTGWAFTPR